MKATPKRRAREKEDCKCIVPTVVIDDLAFHSAPTVEQVWVHLYEIGSHFLNGQRGTKALNAYHSGVEVYGREWSYGVDVDDRPIGIDYCQPRKNTFHGIVRQTLTLGYTKYSPKRVGEIIDELRSEWPEEAYEVWTRNCHHFSDALSRRLGAKGLPAWVHQMTDHGVVSLRVYDLGRTVITQGYNAFNKSYGAFHTGVEVYGREWSFGASPPGYSGIGENPPGENMMHSFRETLVMGHTRFNPEQITEIIEEMSYEWTGSSYEVLTKNCHNFSDAFCQRLGVPGVPSWVNDLAGYFAEKPDGSPQGALRGLRAQEQPDQLPEEALPDNFPKFRGPPLAMQE